MGCRPRQMIKTLIYMADGRPLAVLLRGDREANEGKIRRTAAAERIELFRNYPLEDSKKVAMEIAVIGEDS